MRPTNLLLPISIVLGGAFVGAGVYAGLRARPATPTTEPTTQTVTLAANVSSSATIPGAVSAAPDDAIVAAQIAAALDAEKATLAQQCWKPLIAKNPMPATSTYDFALSVNPAGDEVMRAVGERRSSPSRPDVAGCLRQLVAPISIDPPGRYVSVKVALSFP